jgi:ketosteroid isomerase-like protein
VSLENVELVRGLYEALACGDFDAFFDGHDPTVEVHVSDAYFDAPHTYRGHDGLRELFAAQAEVFDVFRAAPERFFDAGDQVLAIVRAGGRARESGVDVSGRFGHLLSIRDGRVVRFKEFKDPREAMSAAGLPRPSGY